MPKLSNPKHERFCLEYVIDMNGTKAAIRSGYSARSAKEQASDLLTKPNIEARIKELTQKVTDKLEITAEMVLAEYALIAFCDTFQHIDPNTGDVTETANGKLFKQIAIKETDTTHSKSYTMHSKLPALEILAKYTGLLESKQDDVELNDIDWVLDED